MQVTIRKALISELKIIQDLNHKLFLWDYSRDPTMNTDWPYLAEGENYFIKKISGESGVCFVAEQDGSVIGYVIGRVNAQISKDDTILRCELENIYVEDEARSKGVGKLLVNELTGWCKDQGAQSMFVTAFYHNDDAIRFYKTCGFDSFALKLEKSL